MHDQSNRAIQSVRTLKDRFVTLDAMRGVAALAVVLRHFEIETGGHPPRFSYLAVDLFFILSGFVLAYRYDSKFSEGMRCRDFLAARVVRLYPVYAIGLVLSLLVGVSVYANGLNRTGFAVAGTLGLLGLPSPLTPPAKAFFPLNYVFWSLFLEFWIANVCFAFLWRAIRGRTLYLLVGALAVGLLVNERFFYTLDVGFSWGNALGGLIRVGFGFYAGVALARLRETHPPRLAVPSWAVLALLIMIFFAPLNGRLAHLFELITVITVFPALLHWGAEAKERFPQIGKALGDASYIAYAIHLPLLFVALRVAVGPHPTGASYSLPFHSTLVYSLGFCAFIGCLAWIIDLTVDWPLRKALRTKFRLRNRP